jgi:hypothetical protein
MTDPSNIPDAIGALNTGLVALATSPLVAKILGPTADYVGGVTQGLVKKADVNLGQIFAKAARRLGPKLDQPGQVPPRVLRAVISEGRFVEDELGAEYFGGLLASSRTPTGEDDRALALVATVRDMSVYQIRLHYVIHRAVRELLVGRDVKLQSANQRFAAAVYLPREGTQVALGIADRNPAVMTALIGHALAGLDRLGLINPEWIDAEGRMLRTNYLGSKLAEDAPPGLIASPGAFGLELMLAVHGHADVGLNAFLDPTLRFTMDANVPSVAALLAKQ